MPAQELFAVQTVRLKTPIEKLVSQPSRRAVCEICGEEIINQREVTRGGRVLCHACAGQTYYQVTTPEVVAVSSMSIRRNWPSSKLSNVLTGTIVNVHY